jgi:hypothetical protein
VVVLREIFEWWVVSVLVKWLSENGFNKEAAQITGFFFKQPEMSPTEKFISDKYKNWCKVVNKCGQFVKTETERGPETGTENGTGKTHNKEAMEGSEQSKKTYTRYIKVDQTAEENVNLIKYYNQSEFEKLYKHVVLKTGDVMNEECLWKKRIMIIHVPIIGNVAMYYDFYRMGFAYYCDKTGVGYKLENACAMNYVCMFKCMDLFQDDFIGVCKNEQDEMGKEVLGFYKWSSGLSEARKYVENYKISGDVDTKVGDTEDESGLESTETFRRGFVAPKKKVGSDLSEEEKRKLFPTFKKYRTENTREVKCRNKFIYMGRLKDCKEGIFAVKKPVMKISPEMERHMASVSEKNVHSLADILNAAFDSSSASSSKLDDLDVDVDVDCDFDVVHVDNKETEESDKPGENREVKVESNCGNNDEGDVMDDSSTNQEHNCVTNVKDTNVIDALPKTPKKMTYSEYLKHIGKNGKR